MLSARQPYGTIILPAVSSMDELQLARHILSNISGPVGKVAANFIRMFRVSGRVLMEMQGDHLKIVSQGDPNVMEVYLKLQGNVVAGRLRERRRSIVEIYPELGLEFPSIRGHSKEYQSPSQSLNRPSSLTNELIRPDSAPDQGPRGCSSVLRPAGRVLAFDNEPVVNPIVHIRHHHAESKSGHITDESVGLGTPIEDVEMEGRVEVTSRPSLYENSFLSPFSQHGDFFALDHDVRSLHNPPTSVADERHTIDNPHSKSATASTSALVAPPSAQRRTDPLRCSHCISLQRVQIEDDQERAAVPPGIEAMSLWMSIQGYDYSVEKTSHGCSIHWRNAGPPAQPRERPHSHTMNRPLQEQDAPGATIPSQTALTFECELSNQGTDDFHVDERSPILLCPSLDETASVIEVLRLELSGPSGARTIDICDPISNATCNSISSDLRTEDPCPLDLSAVIVADDNEKKMSQNILCTPRASSADPAGKYTPASLPLDVDGISIGSPKRSNSASCVFRPQLAQKY